MGTVPVMTLAHLNHLLDLEQEAAKKAVLAHNEHSEDAKVIIKYLDSFQSRLNKAAFDKIAQIIGEEGRPDE